VSTPVSPEDHRIRVAIKARVTTPLGAREVTVQAISGHGALISTSAPLGHVGRTIDLQLPSVSGPPLTLTAGIERIDHPARSDRNGPGELVSLHFIIADPQMRRALNQLLAALLGGDGGGTRRHPRVIYDTRMRFGDGGEFIGKLEEISLSGAGLRVGTALAVGLPFVIFVPALVGTGELRLAARVVNQRRAPDGGYRTGVAFESLDNETQTALGKLLADLLQR